MKIVTYIIIKSIKCYKFLISPLFGHSCRYLPTCSEYCIEALQTYNLPKALYLSLKRINNENCYIYNYQINQML